MTQKTRSTSRPIFYRHVGPLWILPDLLPWLSKLRLILTSGSRRRAPPPPRLYSHRHPRPRRPQ